MAAKLFPTDKIRNIAVVGHSSTGKNLADSAVLFDQQGTSTVSASRQGQRRHRFRRGSGRAQDHDRRGGCARGLPRLQAQPRRHPGLRDLHHRVRSRACGLRGGADGGLGGGGPEGPDRQTLGRPARDGASRCCSRSTLMDRRARLRGADAATAAEALRAARWWPCSCDRTRSTRSPASSTCCA